jgi:hypothetical protein
MDILLRDIMYLSGYFITAWYMHNRIRDDGMNVDNELEVTCDVWTIFIPFIPYSQLIKFLWLFLQKFPYL